MTDTSAFRRLAILVVEDDPFLLLDALDLAEDAGFKAYGARTADEAFDLLEEHQDIRVLFTDVDMPGSMNGLKLAHAVRDRWPPVTIIVTSGHVHLRTAELPVQGTFIPKPYAPDALTEHFVWIGRNLSA